MLKCVHDPALLLSCVASCVLPASCSSYYVPSNTPHFVGTNPSLPLCLQVVSLPLLCAFAFGCAFVQIVFGMTFCLCFPSLYEMHNAWVYQQTCTSTFVCVFQRIPEAEVQVCWWTQALCISYRLGGQSRYLYMPHRNPTKLICRLPVKLSCKPL